VQSWRLDPIVRAAGHEAKVQPELQADGFIMWCNPGEVKVLLDNGVRQSILHAGAKAANPYSKARLNMGEPTRLNVVAETSSSSSSRATSVTSSPKTTPMLSPFATEFAPAAASDSESDSDGDSGSFSLAPPQPMPPPPGLLVKPPPGPLPMPLLGMPPLPPQPPQPQQGMWPGQQGGGWYPAYGVEAY